MKTFYRFLNFALLHTLLLMAINFGAQGIEGARNVATGVIVVAGLIMIIAGFSVRAAYTVDEARAFFARRRMPQFVVVVVFVAELTNLCWNGWWVLFSIWLMAGVAIAYRETELKKMAEAPAA